MMKSIRENTAFQEKYDQQILEYMAQILNIMLDLYEISGKYESNPPLVEYLKIIHNKHKRSKRHQENKYTPNTGNTIAIPLKLKLLNILGYHQLCKLNKFIHQIIRLSKTLKRHW